MPSRSAPGPATTPTMRPSIGNGVGRIWRSAGDSENGFSALTGTAARVTLPAVP